MVTDMVWKCDKLFKAPTIPISCSENLTVQQSFKFCLTVISTVGLNDSACDAIIARQLNVVINN